MNNKQFLNQRWKNTDKLLRGFQKELTGLTKDLKVDIMDLFEGVNVALTDLHKPISERDKDRLNKSIKQWEKEGLDNDYLNYKLSTRKRKPNYEEYLILMLLGLYAVYMKNTYETSKNTLKAISKDAYSKAVEEMGRQPKNPKRITWGLIEDLLIVNTLNMYLREYLELLVQTNQQEAYKIYLQSKQVSEDAKISEEGLADLLQKQQNRLINIRRDKESGVFVDVSHELWNEMYVEPYKEENVQVRFIAEVDNATTMMCKGMDGMLFYTDDWNRYYRWSELDKRDVLYTTFGLKVGENLPPINNHFHWCRSTITYSLNKETLEITTNELRKAKPNEGSWGHTKSFIAMDGNEYTLLGKDVVKDTDPANETIARWWIKKFGGNVKINPKVNKPEGVKSADFTIDETLVELKTINGSGKNTIYDAIHDSGKQAEIYILDITEQSKLNDFQIFTQIDKLFKNKHTNWVRKIYLKEGENVRVYVRK